MADQEDVIAAGNVISDFQQVSLLFLNPLKTVIQQVGLPPDLGLEYILATHWPSAPPKSPQGLPTPASFQPPGTLFRYLGIFFGDSSVVKEHYEHDIKERMEKLSRYATMGLPYYSRCWLINTFFFSTLVYRIPYVEHYTSSVLRRFIELAVTKVNSAPKSKKHRYFARRFIDTHLSSGGFSLMDLPTFAESLRAARAARFIRDDTPVRNDVTFHFFSEVVGQSTPSKRLSTWNWVDLSPSFWKWHLFTSPTLNSGLRCLASLEPPDRKRTFEQTRTLPFGPMTLQRVRLADSAAYANERDYYRISNMTESQLEYLLALLPLTPDEAQARWRTFRVVLKSDAWKFFLPDTHDDDNAYWLTAHQIMSSHYRVNATATQSLHLLRMARLPLRHEDYHRCCACNQPITCRPQQPPTAAVLEHLFANYANSGCPAVQGICQPLGLTTPTEMSDWIMTEAVNGFSHVTRELAHAIWRFYAATRAGSLDGTDKTVQDNHVHLFTKAQDAQKKEDEKKKSRKHFNG